MKLCPNVGSITIITIFESLDANRATKYITKIRGKPKNPNEDHILGL